MLRFDPRVNDDPSTGSCPACAGARFLRTRTGRELCSNCRGTGTVVVIAAPVEPDGPGPAELAAMLDELDRLLDSELPPAISQRCNDLADKTRLALEAEMQHLYRPLVETFVRIRRLEH